MTRTLAGESLVSKDFGRPFPDEAVEQSTLVPDQTPPHSDYHLDALDPEGHRR
jgi:hypothetical protein